MQCVHEGCEKQAVACWECMRALTLMWWGAVARHPEAGRDCQVCEQGAASLCGDHLVEALVENRENMRFAGRHDFGEPSWLTGRN